MDTSMAAMNHAETIQKLERLNQLETITAEQRIRIEKYRTMYETLKAESEQLDNDKYKRSKEIELVKEEMSNLQSKCQDLVSQARAERDMKIDECEELKMKVMTPQKMEVLKIKLQEEVEAPYKQKLEAMEAEVDKYRTEFNRLRYDYSFLKSEYEHELTQKKTMLDEIYSKFDLEKEMLHKQIKSLTEELNNQDPADIHKIRILQKENTQLNLRVKSLHSELDELRDKKESNNLQSDQTSRLQARQISELSLQCKSLEAEKETCKLQQDRLQKELNNNIREQDTLSNDLHRIERENLQLKSQLEETTHTSKMELNNIKLNLMKDRGELEQDRDNLKVENNVLKNKNTIQEANIQQLKKLIDDKEQESLKRVQAAKEDEWSRINKLENSKAQLESQIASLEQQKLDHDSLVKVQFEQLEEKIKCATDQKERLEKEILNVKNELVQEKQKSKNLQTENENLLEVKQKYQKLLPKYENAIVAEEEIKSDADKMLQTIELIRKELDMTQEDMRNQRDIHMKNMTESKKMFDDEKTAGLKRYTDLQKEHKELKKKHDKMIQTAKKKTKKLKTELALVNEDLQILKSKEDRHVLEKQALVKNLNFEQERMRRKFDKYRHRQHQFSQVLNASNFNLNFSTELSPGKRASSFMMADDFLSGLPPKSSVGPLDDLFKHDENIPPTSL